MANQSHAKNSHEHQQQQEPQAASMKNWRPGGDPGSAKDVASRGDFGVPAGDQDTVERDYVSANTKASDPGNAGPRSSELQGNRTGGVGARYAGPGSASGGDLDPDFLGIGGTGGIAASGKIHEARGPDDTDGSSDAFASGGHAKGQNPTPGHRPTVHGSTVSPADDATTRGGADAATNPARDDDSFAGEISSGEARGEDAVQ